mmetsp:Transcript_31969/g.38654  ORF Transcript_31969/g.38654 Transcript_31969/m.38654 type:complete len:383 (+) Transcript_31969:259-1407(+)|eukprot:CAMPEP_0197856720 /NCGR_PEP_ID=MMETSP1438-20131217/29105_1 /TAXON_ID=1461541 /ORGANISM="Pterosperma sp., Strain CCMP1384" /LENGTH=382 /DNA_ID=CAMNT_0043472277 /DNA_START=259 /DNA_END=1407 /DNA_ORIENTATION=+
MSTFRSSFSAWATAALVLLLGVHGVYGAANVDFARMKVKDLQDFLQKHGIDTNSEEYFEKAAMVQKAQEIYTNQQNQEEIHDMHKRAVNEHNKQAKLNMGWEPDADETLPGAMDDDDNDDEEEEMWARKRVSYIDFNKKDVKFLEAFLHKRGINYKGLTKMKMIQRCEQHRFEPEIPQSKRDGTFELVDNALNRKTKKTGKLEDEPQYQITGDMSAAEAHARRAALEEAKQDEAKQMLLESFGGGPPERDAGKKNKREVIEEGEFDYEAMHIEFRRRMLSRKLLLNAWKNDDLIGVEDDDEVEVMRKEDFFKRMREVDDYHEDYDDYDDDDDDSVDDEEAPKRNKRHAKEMFDYDDDQLPEDTMPHMEFLRHHHMARKILRG